MEDKIIKILEQNEKPILMIVVGESGVGKTTFVKKMKCENNWFESSKALVEEINNSGLKVSHDTIHSLAVKKYTEDPYWQIPRILDELYSKNFLILDGPRRIKEVKRLLDENVRTLIVRIKIPENLERSERIVKRDNIKRKDFKKIFNDELKETEIEKIISLADFEIINNKNIEEFEKTALKLRKIINKYLNKEYGNKKRK